jgi:thermostable 8-oxoguanine DNA glycosylase
MVDKEKKQYRKYIPNSDILNYTFSYNDQETTALHQRVNNNPEIDINDLRRISLWKIDRVLCVDDETIELLRQLARLENISVTDKLVKTIIDKLVNSQGVGFPMASAMLKFIKPDVFPIIDVRAYRALTGYKPYYSTYTYEKYVEYTKILTQEAIRLRRPLREMDEQLYCFDQKHNGKI